MPLPAAARLIEFPLASKSDREGGRPTTALALRPEVDPATDSVEAAFARGREEGLAAGRTEHAAKLEEERAAAAARLVEERTRWFVEESACLGERIDAAFKTLETNIGDAVAAILSPFLEELLRKRAVEELARTMMPLLASGQQILEITGPEDLLEALRGRLGERASAIEFESADDIDVRVVADHTLIETQIEAWMARINGQSA